MYSSVEQIAKFLGGAKKTTNGWDCKCPLHEDKKSSLSVAVGQKGGIVLHCHAGCFGDDLVHYIKQNTNLWPQNKVNRPKAFPPIDFTRITAKPIPTLPSKPVTPAVVSPPPVVTPTPGNTKTKAAIVAIYPYVDEDGKPLFEAVRMEPKSFRQRVLQSDGSYSWSIKGVRRVLYRLPELIAGIAAGKPVLICEGEKDVDAAYAHGLIATCNPLGADTGIGTKWLPEFNSVFQGADVIIVPDQDDPGRKHGAFVHSQITPYAAHVGIAHPRVGKDLSDWLDSGATWESICEAVEDFVVTSDEKAATVVEKSIMSFDEVLAKPNMEWLIKDVIPMAVTGCFYGPSGSGKSFVAFDALCAIARGDEEWFGHRIYESRPVLMVALEGAAGLPQRVKAYMAHKGHPGPNVYFKTTALNILDRGECDELIAQINALGLINPLVNIDTLNQATPGMDENGPEMGLAIAAQKYIAAAINGMVIFTHHTGKDLTKGLRGHSSLGASLDWSVEVRKEADGSHSWGMGKQKDGPDDHSQAFDLKVIEVGKDKLGEPVTSCVVVKAQERDPLFQDGIKFKEKETPNIKLIEVLDLYALKNQSLNDLVTTFGCTQHRARDAVNKLKDLGYIDSHGLTQKGEQSLSKTGSELLEKGKSVWQRGQK